MRHVIQSFATTGAVQLSGLAIAIMVARLLGPEGRGEVALVLLYPMLLHALLGAAVNEAIVFRSARGEGAIDRLGRTAAVLAVAIGMLGVGLGWLAIPRLYDGQRPEVVAAARIYLAMIPLSLVGLFLSSLFQGRLEYGIWNAIRLTTTLVTLAGIGILAWTAAASVTAVVLAYLAGFLAAAVLAIGLASARGWIGVGADRTEVRALLRFAAPLMLAVAIQVASDRLDQLAIANLLPPAELGLYVAAIGLGGIAMVPAATLANVGYPRIAAADTAAARGLVVERYLRAALGLAAGLTAILLAVGDRLIVALFGAAFAPATPILRWYALGATLMAGRVVLAQAVKASGRPSAALAADLIGLGASAAMLVALLPALGAVGAAIAFLVAQAAASAWLLGAARRHAGLQVGRLVRDAPGEAVDYAARMLGRSR
ncbi:MAG: oligosaccharide flippase family protein [Alphaproteobacteria bacterium]